MSLMDRLGRAVRARVGAVAHDGFEIPGERVDRPPEEPPVPRSEPAPAATRPFAIGDRVIAQELGFAEIVGRPVLDHDGLPFPLFELKGEGGGKMIPESRAPAVMRHVVGRESAEIARGILHAPAVAVVTSEAVGKLARAWQTLDLGPEAEGVRDLSAVIGELSDSDAALVERVRRVVEAELAYVLS